MVQKAKTATRPGSQDGVETADSERARARKLRILQAASSAFRSQGFHATGMRDIAAAVGMTVGNLYYYFENKQELLAFCQEETLGLLSRLVEWVRDTDQGPEQQLYLLTVGHVVCLNEGTPGSLAHLEGESLLAESRGRIQVLRDRYEATWRDLVARGIRRGVFRETDPKVAALALLGAANWTVKWFRSNGERSAREIGDLFARQLVGGLLVDGRSLDPPSCEVPSFTEQSADR